MLQPCIVALAVALAGVSLAGHAAAPLDGLKVPPGFHVSIYSDQVPNAREIALGAHDTVFVGSFREGKVYALTGMDAQGHPEHVYVIAKDLEMPVGVAFHDGALYVSAVSRILKYPDIESHLAYPPRPVIVTDKLPDKTHHGWRFIAFGPDGKLYVSIGAPCNICDPGADFAKIIRMNPDGTNWQTIATGIRNSVGFDWQPGTHTFWFTNNGRDLMGDDVPDDTLNRVDRLGENFGFPYCHGGNVPDPEFGKGHPCSDFAQPALRLGAHVASLGMRFYVGRMFPAAYEGAIFIAEHGSWNRSSKVGYRVVVVHVGTNGKVADSQPFLTGFLDGQKTLGRPVDVQPLRDGSLLVSDDYNGVIYRITYAAANSPQERAMRATASTVAATGRSHRKPEPMQIRSDSFENGARIPAEFAFGKPGKPVELSANRNPHLAWRDAPAATKSFALVCIDGDVPSRGDDVNQAGRTVPAGLPRVDFAHWLMIDIPPACTTLAAGSCSDGITPRGKRDPHGPAGSRQGRNDYTGWFASDPGMAGEYLGYDGPCPPWNDALLHRYRFRAYALDVARLGLPASFGWPELKAALRGHVLGESEIVGTYSLNPALNGN